MQDSEDRPQRRSALVASELVQLDIDIAALSKVHFSEQGSHTEDRAGLYPLLLCEEQGRAPPLWWRIHDQNFHCQKTAGLELVIQTASCT